MNMKTEIGAMSLQGKECRDCQQTMGSQHREGRGGTALLTPWFWTLYLQNYEGAQVGT